MRTIRRNLLPSPWMPYDLWTQGISFGLPDNTFGSAVWPSANLAIYIPFSVPCDVHMYALRARGTNATGNYDIGIYDENYTRLASKGSTALSNAVLELSAEIQLRAGKSYWMAMVCSSGSGTVLRASPGSANRGITNGFAQEASALPLPATATPVDCTVNYLPMMVLLLR